MWDASPRVYLWGEGGPRKPQTIQVIVLLVAHNNLMMTFYW